ncbi:MAG: SigE-dependent sporulation protein [Caldibacillus debilis]|uniref:SigE-dependent sporulation protein n=2 Tax=Caldibacillus debilis TaxID=301148 RepID=A0A3E0K3S8_9BACI|nr:sporulation YhaL family protein [Caldibacillus debilis]OUM88920.1 MAG: SigE-dependent sporulation protein [Caldibacillus debilis]REJ15135.1 MAG: SigE-dependent sporulation protein [Caldibacillus debilis]REJ27778.1 MAG: SigE-dependent sporulation protein [Caldibacillus debilis]REJ28160.1 MAG: SigE-dependent sporulation protein [Caldibacillus debilis]
MSWWVYIVVLGIMFSGFMTVWISRKEREEELRQIEKEGEVYIRRMEKEKEKKNRKAMSRGV